MSVLTVTLLLVVGIITSPRGASGRPLLLSPERRDILRFLRQADKWEENASSILSDLDQLAVEIQTFPAPENLYERAHRSQIAVERSRELESSIVQAQVPSAMIDLHRLALEAAVKTRQYAEIVSARIGVPGEIADQGAHDAVEEFRKALHAARGNP